MSRVKLEKGKQKEFLNRVGKYFNFNWAKLARANNICERSLRDWRREKCNRGLMDTDGSFYSYRHRVFNKIYCNFAMCFTNHSKPLLRAVYKVLKAQGFTPIIDTKRVYLHKKMEVDRYFKEVGTHNPKHLQKYKDYMAIRNS